MSAHQFRPRARRRNPAAGILVIAAVFSLGLVAPATSAALSQFRGASSDGSTRFLRDHRAAGQRRHGRLQRRLRALRGDDDPGLPGADQRKRRLQRQFYGASSDGSKVFFHTSEQLVSGDTDSSNGRLRALRGNHDPGLPGRGERQRRLRCLTSRAPRATARRSSSQRTSSWSAATPTAPRTSTSAPGGRRPRSPRGRSTATAPSSAYFAGVLERRLEGLLLHPGAAGQRRHRQLLRHLRALRGDDDPGLPGRGQRQRRLRRHLHRRLERRLEGLLQDRTSSW